jgi:hypothetical protein
MVLLKQRDIFKAFHDDIIEGFIDDDGEGSALSIDCVVVGAVLISLCLCSSEVGRIMQSHSQVLIHGSYTSRLYKY